jgi:hypothetical protein
MTIQPVILNTEDKLVLSEMSHRRHFRSQSYPDHIDGTFKLIKSPEIDAKESIPSAVVAWRSGTTTLVLLGS